MVTGSDGGISQSSFLRFLTLIMFCTGIYCQLNGDAERGIFTAYAKGEGCQEPCGGETCTLMLNGVIELVATDGPGFHLIAYKFPSFAKIEAKAFHTFLAGESAKMITWLNGLDDGTIILGCSRDDAATSMGNEGWTALASVGLDITNTAYRSAHALIGYKGEWPRNMRKSRSTSSGVVHVNYTYVIPPAQVAPIIVGSYVELAWKKIGTYVGDYVISANISLADGGLSVTVPAVNEAATIGPLKSDTWYTLTMQVASSCDDSCVVAPSEPFFIIVNQTGNCSTGIYQFVMKIDGSKQTFKYSAAIWDDSSQLLPEKNSITGFDRLEAKPKAFNNFNVRSICAGMLDLSTNQANFIQIQTTREQPMKDFVSSRTGFPTLDSSYWNFLAPAGVPYAEYTCRQGFGVNDQQRRAELGFLGSSKGGCGSKNTKNVVIGYGLHMDGTDYGCGSVFIDNSDTTIFKPAFGYLLIPYFVNAVWNEWSWGSCNASCGYGTAIRTRNSTNAIGGGTRLPPFENDTQSCKVVDCPPPPPSRVAAQTLAEDKLLIKWDSIPADQITDTLSHYELVQWKSENSPNKTLVKIFSATQKEMSGLEIYTVYCYQIYGVLASGVHGNRSEIVCNSTDESVPIQPPTNISASNSSSFCLNVTWESIPVKQARGIITKYRVYYQPESGGNELYNDSKSSGTDEICGLEPYTPYIIKMSGFTSKGEGVVSAGSSPVFTDEYIPSEAPSIILSKNTSSTSIQITWQQLPATLWRGVPLGYTIFYVLHDIYAISGATTDVAFVSVSHAVTEVQLTQLHKYRNYTAWMTAFTIKGRGEKNSSKIEQMTDEDIPVKGPTSLAHNTSSFSIKVEWSPLEAPYRLGIITRYTVFFTNLKTGANGTINVDHTINSLEIGDLSPFHNHSFEIAASTSKGMGPRGPMTFAFTDEYLPSGRPSNFSGVNISSYDLLLHWSGIPYDEWRGIPLGYTILYRETDATGSTWNSSKVYGESAVSAVIGSLTAYTNHTLRIACFTIKGNGNFSADIVVSTAEDAPYISPQNLTPTAVEATSAVVKWLRPPGDKVKGILRHYKVVYQSVYTPDDFVSQLKVYRRRKRSLTSVITKEVIHNQQSVTVPSDQYEVQLNDLQGFTNYSVQILAVTLKEGPLSEPMYIFTKETVPAMSPVNVTADASSSTSLMVKWKHVPPAYAHGTIKGYIVYYQHGNHSNVTAFSEKQVPYKEYLKLSFLEIFAWYTIQVAAYTSVGVGARSRPIYARTGEYYPSKAPQNVSAESFLLPTEVDVKWLALPLIYWNGIPLGYRATLTAHSVGGMELRSDAVFSITNTVPPAVTSCKFTNLKPFYKYSIEVSAFNKVGDGPKSAAKYVEMCTISNAVMSSSWIEHSPLVKHNPLSVIPDGLLPTILSGAVRHCSGSCRSLGINGNATVNYTLDGRGMPSMKADYQDLVDKMTTDTDFFFPVQKPRFANDKFKFIELIKVDSIVLVEGKPLVNLVGTSVSSSVSGLLTVLMCFLVFCFASGCVVWILETWKRTGQLTIHSLSGILDGFYWAWVTATTVGYGDITPTSVVGKVFSMFWSLAGLILCGFLTGALSTLLTASENPLATAAVPKTGIGMVVDTWELRTAKRTGINIEQNFSSYSDLLDAVAKGKVRYGLLDASVAKVWGPKLAKEKINVKKALKLDGSLGVFAAGHARQLYACFSTYIKEESSSILKAMTITLQKETAKVAKLLAVPENVTVEVKPSKPEFFSWESTVMQAYVKSGSLTLGILLILGIFYELIRRHKKHKVKKKTNPKIHRVERRVKRVKETANLGSHPTIGDSTNPDTVAPHMSPNESNNNKNRQNSLSSSGLLGDGNSELRSESLKQPLILENFNENDAGAHNSELMTTSFIEDPLTNTQTLTSESDENMQGIVSASNYADTLPNKAEDLSRISQETESESSTCSSSSVETCSNSELRNTGREMQDTASAPLDDKNEAWIRYGHPDLHDVPDDESILSYSKSDFYDNDALEMETRQLLAALEERFETLVNEMTEKHGREIWRRLKMDEKIQKQKFGGVYKYFDPNKFSAPW